MASPTLRSVNPEFWGADWPTGKEASFDGCGLADVVRPVDGSEVNLLSVEFEAFSLGPATAAGSKAARASSSAI